MQNNALIESNKPIVESNIYSKEELMMRYEKRPHTIRGNLYMEVFIEGCKKGIPSKKRITSISPNTFTTTQIRNDLGEVCLAMIERSIKEHCIVPAGVATYTLSDPIFMGRDIGAVKKTVNTYDEGVRDILFKTLSASGSLPDNITDKCYMIPYV